MLLIYQVKVFPSQKNIKHNHLAWQLATLLLAVMSQLLVSEMGLLCLADTQRREVGIQAGLWHVETFAHLQDTRVAFHTAVHQEECRAGFSSSGLNLVHSSSLYVVEVDTDESQIGGWPTHHFMSRTMDGLSVELSWSCCQTYCRVLVPMH